MTSSTFRLTRAEFKKIFKRASVYIMALLLVVAVLVSVYIFKPSGKVDQTVNYGENMTVEDYYDNFFNQDLANSKKGIDKVFDNTKQTYEYYRLSNERDITLDSNYADVINSLEVLRNTTDNSIRENKYTIFKNHLQTFYNNFQDFGDLSVYPHTEFSTTFVNYTNSSNEKINSYQLNCSKNIRILLENTKTCDSFDIVKVYDTNNFKEEMYKELQFAKDYIKPTLHYMAKDIKTYCDEFNLAYSRAKNSTGGVITSVAAMESARKSIKLAVENIEKYFNLLVDNDYPIILIKDKQKIEITDTIDTAKEFLGAAHFNGTSGKYSDYEALKESMDNLNLSNYFTNVFDMYNKSIINQIKLKNDTLEHFAKVSNKVNSNSEQIITKIKSFRTDDSIKNIQKSITDYSLLSQSYNQYINDFIIVTLSQDYRSNDFLAMYNYELKDFNDYEYRERIATNKYFIDNNIYSNSYTSNFVFAQNSGKETNAMDFMFFSMEICTVFITIFAMMMICNLITSETESGTIKLLLTRPFRRSKIITAKLLATIFFVICFVIFSAVLSFVAGYAIYGFDNTNILAVFNASSVFVISPIGLMLLNILFLTLDILFYTIIALMISILFKNYAGSISFCMILIIVAYALNILFANMFWYSLLPGMNLHLFKYFGNSFASIATTSVFQNILITPIQSTMSFFYSLLIILGYSCVSIAISYAVFNKRDF